MIKKPYIKLIVLLKKVSMDAKSALDRILHLFIRFFFEITETAKLIPLNQKEKIS